MSLKDEKCQFKESYDLLAGEKASVDDQVTRLDGEVEHLYHQLEMLMAEKKVLEEQVKH